MIILLLTMSQSYSQLKGLVTLKPYQEEAKSNITNTITVATFFSAITATTIQFSYTNNNSSLQSSVNTFWLSSLVLSVTSVLQSILAYLWRQAMYSFTTHIGCYGLNCTQCFTCITCTHKILRMGYSTSYDPANCCCGDVFIGPLHLCFLIASSMCISNLQFKC